MEHLVLKKLCDLKQTIYSVNLSLLICKMEVKIVPSHYWYPSHY